MENEKASIYVVSGGAGASGEQVVRTLLVQFPDSQVQVISVGHVRHLSQIEDVVNRAANSLSIIVHTLVDDDLRRALVEKSEEQGIWQVDLVGPLLARLSKQLHREPIGHPGLYHQLRQDYFDRVSAIEFTMAHDDGRNRHEWSLAEIVLAGVSRVGKTPLSMYLAVLGWKVANVPLVTGLDPPAELFKLDPNRVIGLTIDASQLFSHRRARQQRLGTGGVSDYSDPEAIFEEVKAAHKLFRRSGFSIVNVTDKPIETSADEIITLITRHSPKINTSF